MFSTKLTWYDIVIFSSAAHSAEPPPACRLADFLGIVGIKQMLHDSSQIQMSTIFSECLVSFHILNHHNMIESDFTDRSISKLHCLAEAILLWLGVISSNNTSNKWPKPTNGPTNPENFPAPCHIRLPCNVSCASASAAETKKSTQDSKMKHIGIVQNCGCEFTVFLIYFALYGIQYGIHMNHCETMWNYVKLILCSSAPQTFSSCPKLSSSIPKLLIWNSRFRLESNAWKKTQWKEKETPAGHVKISKNQW